MDIIYILCIILVILFVLKRHVDKFETITLRGISGANGKPSVDTETKTVLSSLQETKLDNQNYLKEESVEQKQKYLDNKIQKYNQMLLEENKDVVPFYNDVLDQNNIYYDSNDLINQIDKIDYSDVKTGYDKCLNNCKDGTCNIIGYSGFAECIPLDKKGFDYGSLYKNPAFTYGLQVPYQNVNNQYF